MQITNALFFRDPITIESFGTHDSVSILKNQAATTLDMAILPSVARKHFEILANEENTYQGLSSKLYEAAREIAAKTFSASRTSFFGMMLVGTGIAAISYHQFANEVRNDILQTYEMINNDEITRLELLQTTSNIIRKIDRSFFNLIFEKNNPTYMCRLLLTHGIALDSERNFDIAQEAYQRALQYETENDLKDLVRYVYARSLRLSNNQAGALIQLQQIGQESSFFRLSQIERSALDDPGMVDEDQVPIKFICPLSIEIMKQPVQYVKNNHIFKVDRIFIEGWIREHHNCPQTKESLSIENLIPDDDLMVFVHPVQQDPLKN